MAAKKRKARRKSRAAKTTTKKRVAKNPKAKKRKTKASGKKATKTAAGYEFLIAELKKDKKAVYADLAAKAKKRGFTVYPVMFGRAKASLGLVSTKKRRKKKVAKRGPGRLRKTGRRGPGRPRKSSNSPVAAVQELVAKMREQERQNEQLRATFERIRSLIDRAVSAKSPDQS